MDTEKIILLIGVILIIYLVINFFVSKCFYAIACEKGFEQQRYFLLPFLLGIIGYLLVVALPDRRNQLDNSNHYTETD